MSAGSYLSCAPAGAARHVRAIVAAATAAHHARPAEPATVGRIIAGDPITAVSRSARDDAAGEAAARPVPARSPAAAETAVLRVSARPLAAANAGARRASARPPGCVARAAATSVAAARPLTD